MGSPYLRFLKTRINSDLGVTSTCPDFGAVIKDPPSRTVGAPKETVAVVKQENDKADLNSRNQIHDLPDLSQVAALEKMATRGKSAFSLALSSQGDAVKMCAELLTGAQIGRNDRLIFSRKTQRETPVGVFKGSLKVILTPAFVKQYLKKLEHIQGEAKLPGAAASIAGGKLTLQIPATPQDRQLWSTARSGNRYIVADLWLGIDEDGGLSAMIPRGREALISATVIFEEAKPT